MSLIIFLQQMRDEDTEQVGGKALSLAILFRIGMNRLDVLCVGVAR